ncbi:hypothetical protein O1D97_18050 [Marinomonas sp. 15G1-11]|uniref:Uncharacterized protein n=1 Tax=Marinomonas phaeophyticola TaxID=3004091 RepID=A0ABT4JZ05_9GAMM|nr:hypothetical protein [Marinomonas sp. 15G1-11]MCZ2723461.1 hypothetical protein [Marinomonas sp. 15G1-11]
MSKQFYILSTSYFITIISFLLINTFLDLDRKNITAAQGVWKSKNNSLLYITENEVAFYDFSHSECRIRNHFPSINQANKHIENIRLNKIHPKGWLLSTSPSRWVLSFDLIQKMPSRTSNFEQIKSLPTNCPTVANQDTEQLNRNV